MQELIAITTDGQGSSVVSARELYSFLGLDLSQWARWAKKNITNNPFAIAGQDWQQLDMMSSKTTDYALTTDFAERLSMLARTEKGEQIRRWFQSLKQLVIEQAQTPAPATVAPATEQMMLTLMQQQSQLMSSQQLMLEQLRADVESIKQTGHRPASKTRRLPTAPPHLSSGPALLRQQVSRKINDYCAYHSAQQTEAYNYLYKRMLDVYGVNVYRLIRMGRESIMDAIERYGHLERLYSLLVAELTYSEE